eukprot:scaffold8212_cov93-Cylindrotheca_fusiformis.AAC.2
MKEQAEIGGTGSSHDRRNPKMKKDCNKPMQIPPLGLLGEPAEDPVQSKSCWHFVLPAVFLLQVKRRRGGGGPKNYLAGRGTDPDGNLT